VIKDLWRRLWWFETLFWGASPRCSCQIHWYFWLPCVMLVQTHAVFLCQSSQRRLIAFVHAFACLERVLLVGWNLVHMTFCYLRTASFDASALHDRFKQLQIILAPSEYLHEVFGWHRFCSSWETSLDRLLAKSCRFLKFRVSLSIF